MHKLPAILSSTIISLCSSFVISTPLRANEVSYKLVNGDVITGILINELSTDKLKVINHPELGRINIKTSSIYVEPKLKTQLDLGLNGTSTGSDNSFGYEIFTKTLYKGEVNELDIGTSLQRKTSNGKNSVDNFSIDVRFDRFLSNEFGVFLYSDFQYNSLNIIGKNESLSAIGVSRSILNTDKQSLLLSTGPSFNWYGGGANCYIDPECGKLLTGAILTAEYEWQISEKLKLEIEDIFSKGLTNDGISSNNFSTNFRFYPFSQKDLNMALRYEINYDTQSDPNTDTSYSFLLGTEF